MSASNIFKTQWSFFADIEISVLVFVFRKALLEDHVLQMIRRDFCLQKHTFPDSKWTRLHFPFFFLEWLFHKAELCSSILFEMCLLTTNFIYWEVYDVTKCVNYIGPISFCMNYLEFLNACFYDCWRYHQIKKFRGVASNPPTPTNYAIFTVYYRIINKVPLKIPSLSLSYTTNP